MIFYQQAGSHFAELAIALSLIDKAEIERAVEVLKGVQEKRATAWIVGNGGSASTAGHFSNDLVKMCGIKAIALPALSPTVTAYGNDNGWSNMFSGALDVLQEPDDALVAISCSGKSLNILQAARGVENLVILTGNDYESNLLVRCKTKALIVAPHDDITIQEDIHLSICHAIAKALKK